MMASTMRKISAETTVVWKYLFPGLWITFTGLALMGAWFQTTEPGWYLFLLGWLIASGYLVWFAKRLKFVSIDENFVYVSQFRKQIQIPL